jgi:predicted glycogen debranching enzyme
MTFDLTTWLRRQSGEGLPIKPAHISLEAGDNREWLVTNGLGSYAGGSISGANTRRYHGLLVASLNPPVQRTVMLSRIDETVSTATPGQNNVYELATNLWKSGAVAPQGHKLIAAFSDLPVPTWCYRLAEGHLIKQVLMKPRDQHVYIGYTWLPDDGATACELDLAVLVNYRDFHGQTQGTDDRHFALEVSPDQVKVTAFPGAQALYLQSDARWESASAWYRGYFWPREFERGLADSEDCLRVGRFKARVEAGLSVTIAAGLASLPDLSPPEIAGSKINELVNSAALHKKDLLKTANATSASAAVKRLVLAADQFLVERASTSGSTTIAGYHWFSDWGRDSMISLSGLCLATGRHAEARSILATFAKYMSEGMLPNYFPDGGQAPQYNTSDATLWWAYALYRYYQATGDKQFVREEQLPLLRDVIAWHQCGTRHGIKIDSDNLITGGDASVQLTWMDAKCGSFVVTPRSGKAVEINALWHNFAATMAYLHRQVFNNMTIYGGLDAGIAAGFEKFWDDKRGYLADVIRQDGTIDDAIRPNQLLAASLTFPVLSREQAQAMLKVVEEHLLTPMGLRTLSPKHPDYKGEYGLGKASANQYDRDITYHQGTVWPWLMGPWVNARIYAYGETEENFSFIREHLKALIEHIEGAACLGSISEIFDGEAPHKPQGCVAQAWSVAELLRVLRDYPQLTAAE